MMTLNQKLHLDLIRRSCEVLAEEEGAIWYRDGGFGYAEVLDEGEWVSYSCNSAEEFALICGH